jgi:SAM-dependent methyltransferase
MQARLRRFFTRQFGNPSGPFGRFIGDRMARGNIHDAEWTLTLLGIQPGNRVLEIGFGPGVSTGLASAQAARGFVAGIDHSATMVRAAGRRNAGLVRAGRMELKQGEVSALPYPDGSFDLAFSLHSIYFWEPPLDGLREIKRVLRPGGLLGITIQPRDRWDRRVDPGIMTLYVGKEIAALFSEAGFRDVRVQSPPEEEKLFLECILGVK